jgi:hypothetical protein
VKEGGGVWFTAMETGFESKVSGGFRVAKEMQQGGDTGGVLVRGG